MKRNSITVLAVFLLLALTLSISTTVFALTGDPRPVQQSSLPQISFLGQGPETFTIEPPLKFLVKTYQNGQFLFVTQDGPTYEAEANERVWTTNFVPAEPMRLFHESKSYGNVTAGCVVNYVQIEDNLDYRRNTFYINGEELQVVEQGMVTYGTFTIPEDGELTFYAEDSIGMVVELCQAVPTGTVEPSETPMVPPGETTTPQPSVTATTGGSSTMTPAPTGTQPAAATPSATLSTPGGIILPSVTPSVTATLNPTATSTATVAAPPANATQTATSTAAAPPANATQTATSTAAVPPANATQGPSATPNPPQAQPTRTNTATAAAILITATPIATPVAIPVTGGVPGPGEIATLSAAIIGFFGLIAAAWWYLLRAYQRGR